MVSITVDRVKISHGIKATVSVSSDCEITAAEVRATPTGQPYGRGIGADLISDDLSAQNGVYSLPGGSKAFSFDVEAAELSADGDYRISVWVQNAQGVWNDCCPLYTSSAAALRGSDGAYVFAKRQGTTEQLYTSAYSGAQIDAFTGGIL